MCSQRPLTTAPAPLWWAVPSPCRITRHSPWYQAPLCLCCAMWRGAVKASRKLSRADVRASFSRVHSITRCCLGTTLLAPAPAPAPANVGTAMGDEDSRRWPTAVTAGGGTGKEHEDEEEEEACVAGGWRMWRRRERPEEEGEVLASTDSFFAEEAMVYQLPLRPDHPQQGPCLLFLAAFLFLAKNSHNRISL